MLQAHSIKVDLVRETKRTFAIVTMEKGLTDEGFKAAASFRTLQTISEGH